MRWQGWTVRVYGLLVYQEHVLVGREQVQEVGLTKFPGGGVHLGESPRAALVREWQEELNIPVQPGTLVYATDFLIPSAFKPGYQVMALYLNVEVASVESLWQQYSVVEPSQLWEAPSGWYWLPIRPESVEAFPLPSDRMAFVNLLKWMHGKS